MFEWSDVRYFLAVHRGGSLSAAARELRVNQTTVGRRLGQLEQALGARLFDRMPQGFALTATGRGLVATAERLEAEAFALERAVDVRERKAEGVVRLSATEVFASRYIAPRLGVLRDRYPGLQVILSTSWRLANLTRHEADVAVRMAPTTHDSLVVRRAGAIAYAVYAARIYVERCGAPSTREDVRRHDLLGYDDSLLHTVEGQLTESLRGSAPLAIRSNSSNTLLAAVRAGLGVALLPCFIADLEPDVVRVMGGVTPVRRDLSLVFHRDSARVPRVRAVVDALAGLFARDAALLEGRRD